VIRSIEGKFSMPDKQEEAEIELVDPTKPGFVDKVTPKKDAKLFLFACTKILKPAQPVTEDQKDYPENIDVPGGPYRTAEKPAETCGSIHFRHAGYTQMLLPYMKPGGVKEVILENRQVMVCVKCKSCFVWDGNQLHDVTHKIDLNAWEKTETEMHKATGPGGEC
jgi:hypothetical protein